MINFSITFVKMENLLIAFASLSFVTMVPGVSVGVPSNSKLFQLRELWNEINIESETLLRDRRSPWFCCQLNKKEDKCLKEMKDFPKRIYVPRGMKCWYGEAPPISYTYYMPKLKQSKF